MIGVGALVTCALLFKPVLYPVADPSGINFTPRPEWYFLGLYELLKLMPSKLEILGTVVIPGLVGLGMILLPWLDRSPSRHPAHRMWVIEAGLADAEGDSLRTPGVARRDVRSIFYSVPPTVGLMAGALCPCHFACEG